MAELKVLTVSQQVDELAVSRRPPEVEWKFAKPESTEDVTLRNNNLTAILNEGGRLEFTAALSSRLLERKLHHFIEVELNSNATPGIGFGLIAMHPESSSGSPKGETWEFKPSGTLFHNGQAFPSTAPWRKGDRVGIHLDRWNGKMEFYLNGMSLGPTFEDPETRQALQEREVLHFLVYSFTPGAIFTLRTARSFPSTLQLQCLLALRPTLKPRYRRTPVYKALAVDKKNQVPTGLIKVVMQKWWWVSLEKKMKQTPTRSSPRLAAKREKARVLMRHTFPRLSCTSVMSTLSL